MTWIKFSDKHPEENESVLVTDGERIGSAYIRYYGENNKHFHLIGAAHGGRWFIVTATLPTGQISNHYENKEWDLFRCKEVEKAPEWDGHTSKDVLNRLKQL